MTTIPMYFPPSPFNLDDVRTCTELVGTAYDMYAQWTAQGKPDRERFSWNPAGPAMHYSAPIWGAEKFLWIFRHQEPFAFVSWANDGTAYLVFRGTESAEDWAEDADFDQTTYSPVAGYGDVHDGFMKLYASMADEVIATLQALTDCRKLLVTGHSLGSGLSTLAVPDVLARTELKTPGVPMCHYNLASPRVGSPQFTGVYNGNGVPTYRIVNTCDLVPTVPLAVAGHILYEHVGTPVDFSAQYGSLAKNHNADNAYRYALEHPDCPQRQR